MKRFFIGTNLFGHHLESFYSLFKFVDECLISQFPFLGLKVRGSISGLPSLLGIELRS